ncbi:MAG: DUF211 domain-containing protein [Candidatus Woesearchaeota archaeon]|nr:DUF211 domain-containing protein [Candidatus Woesearchaeota archaeon]
MGVIRRIVLDVLKPHEPTIEELASRLSDIEGTDGVDIVVYGIEKQVESIKITMEGSKINLAKARAIIEDFGANVHSIDKVTCGSKIVEEAETPQDVD